jgi:hypothetical protein
VHLNAHRIARSEKPILAGLYLSKFDSLGLKRLGFDSFTEAFNVLGYVVGSPPGSIKNYRDEFDPLFSNPRKGWHRRPRRDNCLKVLDEYKNLDLELFTGLIKSFADYDENVWSEVQPEGARAEEESHFAKRLITGLAAEQYFETIHHELPEFQGCLVENTTRLGCGYDFRLQTGTPDDFLAVEVKGLKGRQGSLSLTPKEHSVAMGLRDRFFLFVVKNFQESPFHEIFQNPLSGDLQFERSERTIMHVSWIVNV